MEKFVLIGRICDKNIGFVKMKYYNWYLFYLILFVFLFWNVWKNLLMFMSNLNFESKEKYYFLV